MPRLLPLLAAFLSLALLAPATPAAAKEAPAYIAIGDSLTFGVGASDPATGGYVAITYDTLRKSERYRDRGLDLINLGVPGATSADLLLPDGQLERAVNEIIERQEDTSSADDNVEIITIGIGGNDVLALATPDSPCVADPLAAECQILFEEMLAVVEENLTQVLSSLRETAPKAKIVVLDLYSPLSGRGDAAELIADFAIRGINDLTQSVVLQTEFGADLGSVYPLFRGRAAQLVADDQIHPNDEGHALMGEVVLATIEGREPVLPDDLITPMIVNEISTQAQGQGGLQPPLVPDDDDGSNLALLLAIAIPAALLGVAAVAGVYVTARGR
ncbi:MAG: GDSL-type esterase/lipase family protein [Dehalococcoidia bacterium]